MRQNVIDPMAVDLDCVECGEKLGKFTCSNDEEFDQMMTKSATERWQFYMACPMSHPSCLANRRPKLCYYVRQKHKICAYKIGMLRFVGERLSKVSQDDTKKRKADRAREKSDTAARDVEAIAEAMYSLKRSESSRPKRPLRRDAPRPEAPTTDAALIHTGLLKAFTAQVEPASDSPEFVWWKFFLSAEARQSFGKGSQPIAKEEAKRLILVFHPDKWGRRFNGIQSRGELAETMHLIADVAKVRYKICQPHQIGISFNMQNCIFKTQMITSRTPWQEMFNYLQGMCNAEQAKQDKYQRRVGRWQKAKDDNDGVDWDAAHHISIEEWEQELRKEAREEAEVKVKAYIHKKLRARLVQESLTALVSKIIIPPCNETTCRTEADIREEIELEQDREMRACEKKAFDEMWEVHSSKES